MASQFWAQDKAQPLNSWTPPTAPSDSLRGRYLAAFITTTDWQRSGSDSAQG